MSYLGSTKTGHVTFLDRWGNGRGPRRDWSRAPATLVYLDFDGHEYAYKYTGKRADAIVTINEAWERSYLAHRADFVPVFAADGAFVEVTKMGEK